MHRDRVAVGVTERHGVPRPQVGHAQVRRELRITRGFPRDRESGDLVALLHVRAQGLSPHDGRLPRWCHHGVHAPVRHHLLDIASARGLRGELCVASEHCSRFRGEVSRAAVLQAAHGLFAEKGYAATTVAAIAQDAGVAVDTVYAAVGSKPQLLRELIETAVSGAGRPMPPEQRAWVQEIQAAPTALEKLQLYARTVREIHDRMGPLLVVLREAAAHSHDLADLESTLRTRRAANMQRFARDVASTGELRPGLDLDEMADVVWATNSPEFYGLLVSERGWTPEQYEAWLADSWARLFIGGGS